MNHAKISQSKMQNIEAGIFCDSEALNVLTAATSNYQFEKHAQIHINTEKERERETHTHTESERPSLSNPKASDNNESQIK